MKIIYIGPFPPPYGGVTLKNNVIKKVLINNGFSIEVFNTTILKNYFNFIKLIIFLFKHKSSKGILSISSNSLLILTKILYVLAPRIMKNYIVIVAGGLFVQIIKKSRIKASIFNNYRKIFVESYRMKNDLQRINILNAEYLPNFRSKPINRNFRFKLKDEKLVKFIFISRVSKVKGVDLIFDSLKWLDERDSFQIDVYGPIEDNYVPEFFQSLNNNKKVNYLGIFESDKNNIIDLLYNYDVLLLPTRHKNEGHAGVLTEAKIAGCTAITSDLNFNSEIINHMRDGIILKENSAENLALSMKLLINNIELLNELRFNSFNSAENYFIENYLDIIIQNLE